MLLQLQQPAEAATELRKVLEVNPRFVAARLELGLAYFRLNDRDGAEREWRIISEEQPNSPQVRAYLAMLEKQSQ